MAQNNEKRKPIDIVQLNKYIEERNKPKAGVRYLRDGEVSFDSLTNQKPRKIHRGSHYQKLLALINNAENYGSFSKPLNEILHDTRAYLNEGVFDTKDAERYLSGMFNSYAREGNSLSEAEENFRKILNGDGKYLTSNLRYTITMIVILLGLSVWFFVWIFTYK